MVAAAAGYASLTATSFRGFNEFGVIAAAGALTCWLATYLFMPRLLHHVQGRDPARAVKIVEEVLAAGAHVDEHRRALRDLMEAVQVEPDPRPTCERQQVDHGIGRATDGSYCANRVFKRRASEDLRHPQIFVDHLHDAPPRHVGQGVAT